MHGSVLGFFAGGVLSRAEVRGKHVLEVGSCDVNGSVRPIVDAHGPATYTGVDIVEGPGVDRVCSAQNITANQAHVVISTEMLEHAEDWRSAVLGLVRAVRPNGTLVVTTRSVGFPHHNPPDYWRYTVEAMREILGACGMEVLLCVSDPDPQHPGVFVKARKPQVWVVPKSNVLDDIEEGVTPVKVPKTILGLPFAPDGGGYYRLYLPFKHLMSSSGHQIAIPAPGNHDIVPEVADLEPVDILVGQRFAGGAGMARWKTWRENAGVKLVYEVDDDMLRVDPSGLPHLHNEQMRESIRACMRNSDLITVSTQPLAEQVRRHNPNVAVLPNFVNADLLSVQRPIRDRLTLGWAGGNSHIVDIALVSDVLRGALAGRPDVDMHFVGWDFGPLVGRAAGGRFTPWQINVWDYYSSIDFDIGLIPLADTPFNTSKSWIKALEYMALGIPVIASDTPAYREMVVDGVTGYLVRTEDEWRERLTELINDPQARAEMGAKGRETAAGYTIQEHWPLWSEAYESTMEG